MGKPSEKTVGGWGAKRELQEVAMYVRLVRFRYGPGSEGKARELADDLVPAIENLPGCKGAVCFGDASDGEHGLHRRG